MRFMLMHKNDPHTEAGHPPPLELVYKMGEFVGEYARTGATARRSGPWRRARPALAWCSGKGDAR